MRRTSPFLAALLALSACSQAEPNPQAGGAKAGCETRAFAEIGGPISLIDHTGAAVTEADFKGQPSLVFFGFTYCPDVCPAALVTIDRALKALPEGLPTPRTILISVDPERDTPDAMTSYISTNAFPDDIVGLTGSLDAVTAAAKGFATGFARIDAPDSLAEYTVEHSSIIYLMDEDWSLKTFFTHTATAEDITECLTKQLG